MSNPRPRKAPAETHRHGEAVDVVFDTLRQGIITGRFAPGQRLVIRDLENEIGFSRSTFREAFRRLAAERLVSLIPNRGVAVQRLAPREMADLFEIRELLEGHAARRAAERIDEGDHRRRFMAMWEKVRRGDPSERAAFIEDNQSFHGTIVELAGNSRLPEMLKQLQIPILMFQWRTFMTRQETELSQAEHETIAKAILDGRPEQAEAAMRKHVRRAKRRSVPQ
ncbi:MAG TPA: GntR family transcriptional regulator [Burkholderiales bacterium]|nr:GntR family transcriptional regulator [Burkholderiales bacterium]